MRNLFEKLLTLLGAIMRRPLLIVLVTVVIVVILVFTQPRLVSVESPERVWPVEVVEAHKTDEQPMLDLSTKTVTCLSCHAPTISLMSPAIGYPRVLWRKS